MSLIDIDEISASFPVLQGRLGDCLCRGLTHIPSFQAINRLYERNSHLKGPEFAKSVLKDCGLKYEAEGTGSLKEVQGPFITISNHPYGGIDGIILVDLLGSLFPEYSIIVNKLLSRVEALSGNFIPVTPTGKIRTEPTEDSIKGIRKALEHLRSGNPIGVFPAGAVSDFSLRKTEVIDREWQLPIIRLIKKARVPVIPIRFFDGNSPFFYSLGLIDWRLRNLRLPAEIFNKRGKKARVGIGNVISVEQQDKTQDIKAFSNLLRRAVYNMTFTGN